MYIYIYNIYNIYKIYIYYIRLYCIYIYRVHIIIFIRSFIPNIYTAPIGKPTQTIFVRYADKHQVDGR